MLAVLFLFLDSVQSSTCTPARQSLYLEVCLSSVCQLWRMNLRIFFQLPYKHVLELGLLKQEGQQKQLTAVHRGSQSMQSTACCWCIAPQGPPRAPPFQLVWGWLQSQTCGEQRGCHPEFARSLCAMAGAFNARPGGHAPIHTGDQQPCAGEGEV